MAAYIENFEADIFAFFIAIKPKYDKVNPTRH